ncbi:MAG: low molecular weight phosphotyrosine protein phosphatase [Candidatus Promineifilaceae bacterium]
MPKILVVCTANVCRSPVAEALLSERFERMGLKGWEVSSAGTWASPGQSAAEYSILLMAEHGLDIEGHASQIVSQDMLQSSDLVLCMESGHVEALRAEFPKQRSKIHLLTEMSGRQYSVSDPYGSSLDSYEEMVEEVTLLIDEGLERIIELASENARKKQE